MCTYIKTPIFCYQEIVFSVFLHGLEFHFICIFRKILHDAFHATNKSFGTPGGIHMQVPTVNWMPINVERRLYFRQYFFGDFKISSFQIFVHGMAMFIQMRTIMIMSQDNVRQFVTEVMIATHIIVHQFDRSKCDNIIYFTSLIIFI